MADKTEKITREEALELIEQVIDMLIEVGNGTTDEQLHKGADLLFIVRDRYIE